jgi:hypothetical protein
MSVDPSISVGLRNYGAACATVFARVRAPMATQDVSMSSNDVRSRFGGPGATPLVLLQHYNLDNWDPALTVALARERELILVDYPGVGPSSGEFGPAIADTAGR